MLGEKIHVLFYFLEGNAANVMESNCYFFVHTGLVKV